MQIEKIQFEAKETWITMDSLREQNNDLTSELDDIKSQLLEAKIAVSETSAALDEKDRKKAERMAQMLAGFDVGADTFSENEQHIRQTINDVDDLLDVCRNGEQVEVEDLQHLRKRLEETQGIVRQVEISLAEQHDDEAVKRKNMLEQRLAEVERQYETVLERGLSPSDVEDVKRRLGAAYADRSSAETEQLKGLNNDLARVTEDNSRLKTEVDTLQHRIKTGAVAVNGAMTNGNLPGKSIEQQIADFDVMKKSLMRDLQNRCERVVELEMSLDDARDQYNTVLRTSNNKQQQKKLAFLERNLEALMEIQKALQDQNHGLKKDVAIAQRKMEARNERIQSLEALLHDSQEKLAAANHRWVTLILLFLPILTMFALQIRITAVCRQGTT